jgi:hypothetical protein
LCRKCKPRSGEYWPMIAHIKNTSIEDAWEEVKEWSHLSLKVKISFCHFNDPFLSLG